MSKNKEINLDQKKVFITGITGFTGKFLSERLEMLGANVFGITTDVSEKSENVFLASLENAEALNDIVKKVQPNYIIHLAGISFAAHTNSLPYYATNVIGTENLLRSCLEYNSKCEKIILASSAAIYGDPKLAFVSEKVPPSPLSHYGISKTAMEYVAKFYQSELPILCVRPFNYTGVGQPKHFLVPKIISHFREKKSEIELGNTSVIREFGDVRDAIESYILLMQSNALGIVNLCSGQANTINDIISSLIAISGHEITIRINPDFVRDNDIQRLVGDDSHLQALIQRPYQYSLKETLREMLGTG